MGAMANRKRHTMSFLRPANALMVQYAHYHRDRRNIATHLVGVPLIFMAIGIMLTQPEWVVADRLLTPAWLVWGLTSLWYLSRGNFLLGLATVVVNGVLIALAHLLAPMAAADSNSTGGRLLKSPAAHGHQAVADALLVFGRHPFGHGGADDPGTNFEDTNPIRRQPK
mgnify:CR=1 FL=1